MIESFFKIFDLIFFPLLSLPPYLALIIFSALLTLLISFFGRIFTKKKSVNELKERMEEIRKNLIRAQKSGDKAEINKFMQELMRINSEYMKHSFKILLISLILITTFLPWLNYKYQGLVIASLPFTLPLIGKELNWLYWYAFISLLTGWFLKKILE
jgi:uncharacterized membrane protein (DUF106 family)